MYTRNERLHRREAIDRRPAPAMVLHLIDARIDDYEQAALCGQMAKRSGCVEVAPVDNPRVTVCPACQAARDAQTAPEADPETAPEAATAEGTTPAAPQDFLGQMLEATHTYGAAEAVRTYRDRDGSAWCSEPSALTVEVRIRTRRRITTTFPDGRTAQGWETLDETTAPYDAPTHQGETTMTIDALIDTILAGTTGEAAYTAYDAASRAAANARGQVLDVRANAVLDVVKRDVLSPWSHGLTDGGRAILEGLRTREAADVAPAARGAQARTDTRLLPAAAQARALILAQAPALIAQFSEGSTTRTALEALYAEAQDHPPLTRFAVAHLESYARTMHRQPPTKRTIRGLLSWCATTHEP